MAAPPAVAAVAAVVPEAGPLVDAVETAGVGLWQACGAAIGAANRLLGRNGTVSSNATSLVVQTPHGPAVQEQSEAALALRTAVEQGATIFRQGRFGVQETDLGQFWAPVNPLTVAKYAEQFGTAGTNEMDWVMGATVKAGATFVTRTAPAFGNNPGGALEVVTGIGGVIFRFFHMP